MIQLNSGPLFKPQERSSSLSLSLVLLLNSFLIYVEPVCLIELPVLSSLLSIKISVVVNSVLTLEVLHLLVVPIKYVPLACLFL